MIVNGVDTAKSTTSTTSPTSSTNMIDYNGFLQLLIAQMRNQDPTNPTDSTPNI